MQAAHAARITFLKEGHYEEPLMTDADMCVPPLLHTFSGKVKEGDPQPAGNHSPISSCAFGPARILAYEKASNSFMEDMKLTGPSSIPKLRALIEYDIAYFHLRKLKWKPKRAAHLQGTSADDDDAIPKASSKSTPENETEINFLDWSVTDVSNIPWAALQFSATNSDTIKENDVPAHLLPGLLIAVHAMLGQRKTKNTPPEDLNEFWVECKNRIAPPNGNPGIPVPEFLNLGQGRTKPTQTWRRNLRTRDFTDEELKLISDLWETVNAEYLDNEEMATRPEPGGQEPKVHWENDPDDAHHSSEDTAGASSGKKVLRSATPKAAPAKPAAGAAAATPRPAGGRVKSKACVKTVAEPIVRSDTTKKRRRSSQRVEVPPNDASIPKSTQSGRVLHGQLPLNLRFPKNYASSNPQKEPPIEGITLSQAWHMVSCPVTH